MTTVTASIISTDESEKLTICLESIYRQSFDGTINVVVVSNGSKDGSDVAVASAFPDVKMVMNERRMGFAENHNMAIAMVPADFALVLNPDVVLAKDCITQLMAAMQRHERAGMIGPRLAYPTGEVQPSARRFPRLAGTIIRRTPLRRLMPERVRHSQHYMPPPTEDRQVDWMLGACLLFRANAWKALRGFDPDFRPLYIEDIDLAWRMWESGWEVWQSPAAEAMHEHQAATDKVFLDRRTLWHASGMLRFVRKHPEILLRGRRPKPKNAGASAR